VAACLLLALRSVPADDVVGSAAEIVRGIDWSGIALFAASVTALLVFILGVPDGIPWPLAAATLTTGGLLVMRERRARTPFIDMAVVGDRGLAAVFTQYAAVNLVFYATFYAVPQWLEQVGGYGPGEVGLIMLSLAGMGVLVTPIGSRVTARRGPRPILAVGGVTLLAGTLLLLTLDGQTPLVWLFLALVVLGIPNGCNNIGLQALLYDRSTDRHQGAAAGFFQTSRYTAAIVSTAVMGGVLGEQATTEGLHDLALIAAPIAVLVLVAGLRVPGRAGGQPAPSSADRSSSRHSAASRTSSSGSGTKA
jgi:MFS family permease